MPYKDPEKQRLVISTYRAIHADEIKQYNSSYHQRYKEKRNRYSAKYRRENKQELLLYDQRYYQAHKLERAAYVKKRMDYYTRKAAKRRARLAGATGSHTIKEWHEKKQLYGNRCFYCGRKMKRLTKDHVIPFYRGGSDDISNIVPACQSCNSSKSTKELEDFLKIKAVGQISFLF